ncbi:MAG: tetratricopeptide repeat protein, partial [Phycisphaerae bacterium]|nr:tetratricopeptide repeat protein [Phycisphaerae bacterium]
EAYGLADAIAKLTGWLKVRPKSWDLCLLLGNLHVQADQVSQGIEIYRKALGFADKANQKVEATVRIGGAYYRLGKLREAEKAYLAALKIVPNHAPTLNNLAYLYVNDMNQPAKALPHSALAFKQMPYDRNILDTYGWVLAALGDYGKAERSLNRSLQMGRPMPPSLYHLGWVYEKTGRVTQAHLRYQQALKLLADGKDDRLRQAVNKALERLKKRKG